MATVLYWAPLTSPGRTANTAPAQMEPMMMNFDRIEWSRSVGLWWADRLYRILIVRCYRIGWTLILAQSALIRARIDVSVCCTKPRITLL